MIYANAAITLLEKDLKKFRALNGIRNHDLCVTGAMLYQLSYQSHMRAVVCGFGPLCSVDAILGRGNRCPTVAIKCDNDDIHESNYNTTRKKT